MKKVDYLRVQIELPFYPTVDEVAAANVAHIHAFKEAYWAHTNENIEIRDDMSDAFINRLAEDSAKAKEDLRRMMRRSQYWREDLQAWAIPMFHKQSPNRDKMRIAIKTAIDVSAAYTLDDADYYDLRSTASFFATPDNVPATGGEKAIFERLAHGAYREGQSKRKTFVKIAKRLGFWDDSSSSSFQHYLRQYDDERGVKDLRYTLYVSINPAHFLSMSNPKDDERGEAMVSCHSFNGECGYKSGCIGYARDSVTLIAFTAANDGEAMLNRKKSRQILMYHKGALLQSRLYSSRTGEEYGGIRPGQIDEYWEYKDYRMVIQDLIAACEGSKSVWKTVDYCTFVPETYRRYGYLKLNKFGVRVNTHEDFGGYADWDAFARYGGLVKISVRNDMKKRVEDFTAGAAGLHITTGGEVSREYSIVG